MRRTTSAILLAVLAALLTAGCSAVDFTAVDFATMAATSYNAGRYDEALAQAKEATETDPGYASGWYWLGVAQFRKDQYDEAIKTLQKFFTLSPTGPKVHSGYNYLGAAYSQTRKFELAIPLLKRALELSPNNPVYQNDLGAAHLSAGQYPAAVESFRRALTIDLLDPEGITHRNLGSAYYFQGEWARAIDALGLAKALGNARAGEELEVARRALAARQRAAASAPPATGRSPMATAAGSGFLLKGTRLVLTNHHVVEGKSEVTVVFPSGEEYPGRVAFRDRGNDLALVEAQGRAGSGGGLALAVGAELKVGETVHALGYPLGSGLSRKPSMVSGAISSTLGLGDDIARFRTTAPINPGNSGGPIVNQRGQVVGIAAAGLVRQEVEAIRFGIKAATAAPLLQQANVPTSFDVVVTPARPEVKAPSDIFAELSPHVVLIETRGGSPQAGASPAVVDTAPAWLGVSLATLTPELASRAGLPDGTGLVVREVLRDGPAEKAGLRAGDIILGFDQTPAAALGLFVMAVAGSPPGQTVSLKIRRGTQDQELRVTLGQRPPAWP